MRMILAGATLVLLTAPFATACSGDDSPKSAPTYMMTPRTVRPDEKAERIPPASDGDTSFTVLGLTTAMPELVGSHAEVSPKGQYVRVRLLMVNNGRTTTLVNVTKDSLIDTSGKAYQPDLDAMTIKRQPLSFDIGASVRMEFDLWYDIPKEARVAALRLYGGSTLTDLKDEQGIDVKLT